MRNLPRTAPGCSRTLHFRCERAPYTQPTRRAKKKKDEKQKQEKHGPALSPHPFVFVLCCAASSKSWSGIVADTERNVVRVACSFFLRIRH